MRSAVLLALTLSTASLAAADANTAPIQTGTGHEFARTDYSGSKVFLVNKDGKATWEYAAKHCNDLWVLPNGIQHRARCPGSHPGEKGRLPA